MMLHFFGLEILFTSRLSDTAYTVALRGLLGWRSRHEPLVSARLIHGMIMGKLSRLQILIFSLEKMFFSGSAFTRAMKVMTGTRTFLRHILGLHGALHGRFTWILRDRKSRRLVDWLTGVLERLFPLHGAGLLECATNSAAQLYIFLKIRVYGSGLSGKRRIGRLLVMIVNRAMKLIWRRRL